MEYQSGWCSNLIASLIWCCPCCGWLRWHKSLENGASINVKVIFKSAAFIKTPSDPAIKVLNRHILYCSRVTTLCLNCSLALSPCYMLSQWRNTSDCADTLWTAMVHCCRYRETWLGKWHANFTDVHACRQTGGFKQFIEIAAAHWDLKSHKDNVKYIFFCQIDILHLFFL